MAAQKGVDTHWLEEIDRLQRQIADLELAARDRDLVRQTQRETEDRYLTLFKLAADSIVLIDAETAEFAEFNDQAYKTLGYTSDEFKLMKIMDLDPDQSHEEVMDRIRKNIVGLEASFEARHRRKDGAILDVLVSGTHVVIRNKSYILTIWRDITERKQFVRSLMEKEVKLLDQAKNLEETNTALKVLLKHRDEEKERLVENVLSNVKRLVEPYLKRLSQTQLDPIQENLLSILESNLATVTSPFAPKLSSAGIGLTPRELDVANLVKNGLTNQEIGEVLCLSENAVSFHRRHIRKKLGLTRKKINLQSHLQNIA